MLDRGPRYGLSQAVLTDGAVPEESRRWAQQAVVVKCVDRCALVPPRDVIDRWRYHGKCVVNVHHVRFEVPHRSVEVTDLGGVPDRVPPRFPAREPLQLVVRDVVLGRVVAGPPQELVLGLEHSVLATALLVRVVDDHYPHLSTPDDLPASTCPPRESRHRQT